MFDEMKNFLVNFKFESMNFQLYEDLCFYEGMTPPGTRYIINQLCSFIGLNKCYLEIGTHKGSSLCSAAHNNTVSCYGVDVFAPDYENEFLGASIEDILKKNISKFSNIKYFKDDGFKFLKANNSLHGEKVEVYYYDGPHDYKPQYYGILMAMPLLAEKAIILVDDTDHPKIKDPYLATMDACKMYPDNFKKLKIIKSCNVIPNGLMILEYNKNE